MRSENAQPFMQLRAVGKRFGGVEALRNVDLDIHSGEVLGLLGDNGAGKTTLVKVLAGVHSLSSGEIWCNG
jgi:ABC-type sugar transport system ATPase subunit